MATMLNFPFPNGSCICLSSSVVPLIEGNSCWQKTSALNKHRHTVYIILRLMISSRFSGPGPRGGPLQIVQRKKRQYMHVPLLQRYSGQVTQEYWRRCVGGPERRSPCSSIRQP